MVTPLYMTPRPLPPLTGFSLLYRSFPGLVCSVGVCLWSSVTWHYRLLSQAVILSLSALLYCSAAQSSGGTIGLDNDKRVMLA